MRDVAALAGVSVGTVSNVLNSPDLVSGATRDKVQLAIDKLGWVRNESARQLRAGKSSSVGMVVLDVTNPFFTDIVRNVENLIYEKGYSVLVGDSAQLVVREAKHLEQFEQQRVGGVLLAPVGEISSDARRLPSHGIPVVLIDRAAESSGFCSVGVDDVEGGRLAVQHLIDKGHRRIAFVGGPDSLVQIADRRRGAEYAEAGSRGSALLTVVDTPALDVASGARIARRFASMQGGKRPTAVFAANDLLAIGLLQGMAQAGLSVPKDVAIVGYDDIGFASATAIPLSSVHQPRSEIGRQAVEMLFREIKAKAESKEHDHESIRSQPRLVIRRSSDFDRRPR